MTKEDRVTMDVTVVGTAVNPELAVDETGEESSSAVEAVLVGVKLVGAEELLLASVWKLRSAWLCACGGLQPGR